jgi:hypothetical protein
MDTGLLDSQTDFGINARPADRIQYRRVATCAPVRGQSFVSIRNVSTVGQTIFINAGPNVPLGDNYTFSYIVRSAADGFGYSLRYV